MMATNENKIKLVIEISEEAYNIAQQRNDEILSWAELLIKNGTPLEQEPTTKNDLGVSKGGVLDALRCCYDTETFTDSVTGTEYIDYNQAVELVNDLPSVTSQEPQSFKWCTDCKEYDQEKHCCHRYSKVIRDAVAEIEQEPILDKIRAEIEKLQKMCDKDDLNLMAQHYAFGMALEIIDKYKAESEG